MPAERREAERGCDLTDSEVREQNTRGSRATQPRDDGTRSFLETGVLEQADNGQHQPHDRDVPAGDKRLSKRCHHCERTETAGDAGRESRDSHDEERIYPEDESDDDDDDPDEGEHGRLEGMTFRTRDRS